MPRVSGFLRVVKRGGRPDNELPGGEDLVDPGYGIEGPEHPEIDPPPGIWPPLTPEHPWRPIPGLPERPGHPLPRPPGSVGGPPGVGGGPARPERPVDPGYGIDEGGEGGEVAPPIVLPPGTIWPPLPPDVHGKYLALVLIGGLPGGPAYRYVVIDADAKPGHGLPRPPGGRPDQGLPPTPPTPEPKK